MKKTVWSISLLFFYVATLTAQSTLYTAAHIIHTKEWSRDSLRKIQYSDWKKYTAHTIDQLIRYKTIQLDATCLYGGDRSIQLRATGFYHISRIDSIWNVIDPDGHPFIVSAVNSIRPGKSPLSEQSFLNQFGNTNKWIAQTISTLQTAGFNTAGSWSTTDAITSYNKSTKEPFAYTTQLGLLAGYIREAIKLDSSRKSHPAISFIFDLSFVTYCEKRTKELAATANDPNLFGHFSDNEIAFQHTELDALLKSCDAQHPTRQLLTDFCSKNQIRLAEITRLQKEQFIGLLGDHYFSVVSAAIKKYDANHLYLGSRLHASAKNNHYLIEAADQYVDIHSINYYGYWEPLDKHLKEWSTWAKQPFFITEFYTKAIDSGLPNISGAGWLVKTQEDRGIHYQNFVLKLLQSPFCVGWHWFRYQDNDPSDPSADPSNNDSNKGIVTPDYRIHTPLLNRMNQLNNSKYSIRNFLQKSQ